MSRLQLTIVRLMGVVAIVAVVVGFYRINPILGFALFVASGLGFAGYLLRDDLAGLLSRALDFLGRPVGSAGLAVVGLWIVTAPAVLFFEPAAFAPSQQGHIDREPRASYQLFSDDVAYVAASRNWGRTVAN